jgi:hypothetical protein
MDTALLRPVNDKPEAEAVRSGRQDEPDDAGCCVCDCRACCNQCLTKIKTSVAVKVEEWKQKWEDLGPGLQCFLILIVVALFFSVVFFTVRAWWRWHSQKVQLRTFYEKAGPNGVQFPNIGLFVPNEYQSQLGFCDTGSSTYADCEFDTVNVIVPESGYNATLQVLQPGPNCTLRATDVSQQLGFFCQVMNSSASLPVMIFWGQDSVPSLFIDAASSGSLASNYMSFIIPGGQYELTQFRFQLQQTEYRNLLGAKIPSIRVQPLPYLDFLGSAGGGMIFRANFMFSSVDTEIIEEYYVYDWTWIVTSFGSAVGIAQGIFSAVYKFVPMSSGGSR